MTDLSKIVPKRDSASGRAGWAFTVAYLKRAPDHLHKSQAGLETVAKKKLLPDDFVAEARRELFAVREGILRLMQKLRDEKG